MLFGVEVLTFRINKVQAILIENDRGHRLEVTAMTYFGSILGQKR